MLAAGERLAQYCLLILPADTATALPCLCHARLHIHPRDAPGRPQRRPSGPAQGNDLTGARCQTPMPSKAKSKARATPRPQNAAPAAADSGGQRIAAGNPSPPPPGAGQQDLLAAAVTRCLEQQVGSWAMGHGPWAMGHGSWASWAQRLGGGGPSFGGPQHTACRRARGGRHAPLLPCAPTLPPPPRPPQHRLHRTPSVGAGALGRTLP